MASTDLLFDQAPHGPGPVDLVFGATAAEPVQPGVHLVFRKPRFGPGPVDLVFGADPDAPVVVIDPVTLQSAAQITGIAQHLGVAFGVGVQYSAQITGLARVLGARYDININRATVAGTRAVWQDATSVQTATAVTYRQALPVPARIAAQWQDAQKTLFAKNVVLLQDAQRLRNAIASAFEQAQRLPSAPLAVVLQDAQRLRNAVSGAFEQATRTPSAPLAILFEQAFRDRRAQVASAFQAAHRLGKPTASGMGIAVQISLGFDAAYQQAWPPRPGRSVVIPPPPPVIPGCYDPALPAHLVFRDAPFGPGPVHLVFACPPGTGPVDPEQPGGTFFILPARFYMSVHSLTAQHLPSGAPVPIFDVSLSADAGSFAWTFSASAPASVFDQLAPTAGLPAQIRITLDGLAFVFIVDSLQREEKFGQRGVKIGGRSATALLARPYARETARLNTEARNAQQLAESALEFSGATLDWGLTDWLVPAGAWSHAGTPLAAVQAIAEAAGGYIQSHRSAATLLARHPYPTLPGGTPGGPWNWGGAFAADVELAPDAIITTGIERRDGPDINAVYVSGTTQGVIALVKRTGTAGDKLAQLLTDPLITAVEAAQQRGLSVLGAGGPKHIVSLSLPVLTGAGQPGVLDVGQLVQVNAAQPWRGRVRSVSVSAKLPAVRQTVSLERHLETV